MLSHIQMLKTLEPFPLPIPKPQDTALYVFPNHTTGALMCAECPLEVGPEVELLLFCAHVHRKHLSPPPEVLPTRIAAKMIGISQSTLRRWVAKGWIRAWSRQGPIDRGYPAVWNEDECSDIDCWAGPGYLFCSQEVEAYRLAKPRDL